MWDWELIKVKEITRVCTENSVNMLENTHFLTVVQSNEVSNSVLSK